MKLKLTIVSPEKVLTNTEADSVSVFTPQGQITVLPNHIPLVSVIVPGEIIVKNSGEESYYHASGGFLQVENGGEVRFLVDAAEHISEIDEARAEAARAKAKAAIDSARLTEQEFAVTYAALERSLSRLNFIKKHSSRSRTPITGDSIFKE